MTVSLLSVATERAAQRLSNVQTSLSRVPIVSLVIPFLTYTVPPWEEWRGTVKALEPLPTGRGATWKESLYEDGLQHRKGIMVPCPIEQASGNMVYWHSSEMLGMLGSGRRTGALGREGASSGKGRKALGLGVGEHALELCQP